VAENRIVAETRNEFGKGAARRIRRDHKVPAVLYGHGQAPVHLTLPGHATQLALRQQNVLLTIEVDGTDELALPKQVQRNPIRGDLEHVDLILVRRGEKVHVDITVHVTGEAAPDSLVVLELSSVGVTADHDPRELRGQRRGTAARDPVARARPAPARRCRPGG
jgi:large subunit ribosomal protein L25